MKTTKALDKAFFILLDEINQIIKLHPEFSRYLLSFKCILNVINLKFQRVVDGKISVVKTNNEIERFIKLKALEINLHDMTKIFNKIYGEADQQKVNESSKAPLAQQLQLMRIQGFQGNLHDMKIHEAEAEVMQEMQLLQFVCENSNQYKDLALKMGDKDTQKSDGLKAELQRNGNEGDSNKDQSICQSESQGQLSSQFIIL